MERPELAVALRASLGDWAKVVALLTARPDGDPRALSEARNSLGLYYAEHNKWRKARQCFQEVRPARRDRLN